MINPPKSSMDSPSTCSPTLETKAISKLSPSEAVSPKQRKGSSKHANRKTEKSSPSSPKQPLGPYDILCGRGKTAFHNIGNRRFRVTISLNLDAYNAVETRTAKAVFIENLVNYLKAEVGARFVTRQKDGSLLELNPRQTRQKVGHALRDLSVMKQQTSAKQEQQGKRPSIKSDDESYSSSSHVSAAKEQPSPEGSKGQREDGFDTDSDEDDASFVTTKATGRSRGHRLLVQKRPSEVSSSQQPEARLSKRARSSLSLDVIEGAHQSLRNGGSFADSVGPSFHPIDNEIRVGEGLAMLGSPQEEASRAFRAAASEQLSSNVLRIARPRSEWERMMSWTDESDDASFASFSPVVQANQVRRLDTLGDGSMPLLPNLASAHSEPNKSSGDELRRAEHVYNNPMPFLPRLQEPLFQSSNDDDSPDPQDDSNQNLG